MNKGLAFLIACLTSGWATITFASPLDLPGMRQLCAQAEARPFIPMPGISEKPHPEPLFHAIESGAGYKQIQRMVKRHPEWVNRPESSTDVEALIDKAGASGILDASELPAITPLSYAAYLGNWPAVKALIDAGAPINPAQSTGGTPLESAVQGGQFHIACQLLVKGALLPSKPQNLKNLLKDAIIVNDAYHADSARFAEYLLSQGSDVNDIGSVLETPLMGAISVGNLPMVEVLLKHNARIDLRMKGGKTALSVARQKKQTALASRLQRCLDEGATTCPPTRQEIP